MKITHHIVRTAGEWAEFFVSERDPETHDRGYVTYAATWSCVSSFGVFGYHWSQMGEPFAKFVAEISEGYLLGKIGRKVASAEVVEKSVKAEILRARRGNRRNEPTKLEARDAWNAVNAVVDEGHNGEVTAMKLYEDDDINKVVTEWTDIETREFDNDAVQFVRKLWPAFVAMLNTQEG